MKYAIVFDDWLSFDEILLIFKWAEEAIGNENWTWIKQKLKSEVDEYPCGIRFKKKEDIVAFSLKFPIQYTQYNLV